jgi:hypothetical protein
MGEISFAELDTSIQGWIAQVGHADSWGCAALSSTVSSSALARIGARSRRGRSGMAEKIKAALARRLSVVSTQKWETHTTRNPMTSLRKLGLLL